MWAKYRKLKSRYVICVFSKVSLYIYLPHHTPAEHRKNVKSSFEVVFLFERQHSVRVGFCN